MLSTIQNPGKTPKAHEQTAKQLEIMSSLVPMHEISLGRPDRPTFQQMPNSIGFQMVNWFKRFDTKLQKIQVHGDVSKDPSRVEGTGNLSHNSKLQHG